MKKKIIFIISILAIISSTSAIAVSMSAKAPKHPSDYKIGITYSETLQEPEKPVLALFYADWCTYCMKFMPKYNILNTIYKNKFNFVMINIDDTENKKLVNENYISAFPTVYILDKKYDNKVLLPNAIYQDLGKFRAELDRYVRIRAILDSK